MEQTGRTGWGKKRMWIIGWVIGLAILGHASTVPAEDDNGGIEAKLRGFHEVPAVSSTGEGRFMARIRNNPPAIDYRLSFSGMEGSVLFAHIHLGQKDVNGGVIAFLCGGGGKPTCPVTSGMVEGTILPSDVVGPAGQGIASGEFDEAIRAIRKGVTYVNVHSDKHPSGEIRGQIKD